MPITIPNGVDIKVSDTKLVSVKGPKGQLTQQLDPDINVTIEDGTLTVTRPTDQKRHRALHGLYRALINNMVEGVSNGYVKDLEVVGVGYRAQVQGQALNLTLGFSHPVVFAIPKGITIETPSQTEIIVKGMDKQQVGQVAAVIRSYRPVEPYKGKGVRYSDEIVIRKEVKKK